MYLCNQPYGYKKIPPKEELVALYQDNTLANIASHYNTSLPRVRRWFKAHNIHTNGRGGGNNRKVVDKVTGPILQEYVDAGFSRAKIASLIGCGVANVSRLQAFYGIKRIYDVSEYKKYARKVRHLTEQTYAKYYQEINPNKYPRTLCGVEGGYQLDHILPLRRCFDEGIEDVICAAKHNLQMIPWEENLRRRSFKNE